MDIAKGTGRAVGNIVLNTAKTGENATKIAADVVQLVDDVTNSARKSIDVVNTAQDNAIAALRGSSKIIDSGSMLSVEAINGLTKNTENALTLSSQGLTTITASVGVLNEFLTTNKTTLSNLVGGPIEIANQVTTGINSLLKIVLISPINAIIKRLEAYGMRTQLNRDAALKTLQNKIEIEELQRELDKTEAMIRLARASIEKKEQLAKLMMGIEEIPSDQRKGDLVPLINEIKKNPEKQEEVIDALEVENEINASPSQSGGMRKKRLIKHKKMIKKQKKAKTVKKTKTKRKSTNKRKTRK
uniref:Uncharacterized protein n=1 Tax=viral metagenome TaxID=1070528 RepID=A0A6C0JK32_9ZZZZ